MAYIKPQDGSAGYLLTRHDVSTVRIESTDFGGYGWGMLFRDDVSFAPIDGSRCDKAQIPEHVKAEVRAIFRGER